MSVSIQDYLYFAGEMWYYLAEVALNSGLVGGRRVADRSSRDNAPSTKLSFGSALGTATHEIKDERVFTCWLPLPAAPS
jgi:hypothetical protein